MPSFLRFPIKYPWLAALAAALPAAAFLAASIPSSAAGADGVRAPAERTVVPDFVMTTMDGKDWRLSDHRGRVLVVNLFATWCPPCRAEMPMLVETARTYAPKGVEFAGVSLDQGGAQVVQPFIDRYKIHFPVVFPGKGPSVADGVRSIPVTLLIDRQGRLAQAYGGLVAEEELKRDLDQLVAEAR